MMKITFLGTGTSQGVPVIACPCEVCHSTDVRDQRLRVSILVETEGKTLVVDAGPDFRQQLLRAGVTRLDGVLLTHSHKDHIAGLDDVRAFNFLQQRPMDIWADAYTLEQLHREFPYVFDGTDYPGIPQMALHTIAHGAAFEAAGIAVQPVPVLHFKMPVNGFRFGRFAYVTDASYIPPASMDMLRNLDVLVLNALRRQPHISHFTLQQALDLVEELRPKQAYFTHISHLLGKHVDVSQELPPHAALAHDGLVVQVA